MKKLHNYITWANGAEIMRRLKINVKQTKNNNNKIALKASRILLNIVIDFTQHLKTCIWKPEIFNCLHAVIRPVDVCESVGICLKCYD